MKYGLYLLPMVMNTIYSLKTPGYYVKQQASSVVLKAVYQSYHKGTSNQLIFNERGDIPSNIFRNLNIFKPSFTQLQAVSKCYKDVQEPLFNLFTDKSDELSKLKWQGWDKSLLYFPSNILRFMKCFKAP